MGFLIGVLSLNNHSTYHFPPIPPKPTYPSQKKNFKNKNQDHSRRKFCSVFSLFNVIKKRNYKKDTEKGIGEIAFLWGKYDDNDDDRIENV